MIIELKRIKGYYSRVLPAIIHHKRLSAYDIENIGYYEYYEYRPERIAKIIDWMHVHEEKPEGLHANIMFYTAGVIFHNPLNDHYHLCMPNFVLVEINDIEPETITNALFDFYYKEEGKE